MIKKICYIIMTGMLLIMVICIIVIVASAYEQYVQQRANETEYIQKYEDILNTNRVIIQRLKDIREVDINGSMKRDVIVERYAFIQGALFLIIQEYER